MRTTHLSACALLTCLSLSALGCEPEPSQLAASPSAAPGALPAQPPPALDQTLAPPAAPESIDGSVPAAWQPPPELAKGDEEPVVPAEGKDWGIGRRSGGGLPSSIAVRFEKPSYTWTRAEAAAGVTLRYRIVVSEPIPGVTPDKQTSAAPGQIPPKELLHLPSVEGGGHRYANVDGGLGPMTAYESRTVPAFSEDFELRWEGKSWSGPSCTGQPLGPAFPPGTYRFQVRVKGVRAKGKGSRPYRVEWSVPITITE